MSKNYTEGKVRHDWQPEEALALFAMPLMDLLFLAQTVHRRYFDPNEIQHSTLLNIKTGACPEDCGYCTQSGRFKTPLEKEKLMSVEKIVKEAAAAKAQGASRFCMGAAWRGPSEKDFVQTLEIVKAVKALGLETCTTFGMLTDDQARRLAEVGLDYYNHNLDTSPEYYPEVITSHTYQDRLDTLSRVREAGVKVCSGGILGMGETRTDRAGLLLQFANLPQHPESVPINLLIPMPGTPLENAEPLDNIEFVRTVAVARIMLPRSFVRLSAGRLTMSDEMQALSFFAGANSIHMGEKLLTSANPSVDTDQVLFAKLGLKPLDLAAFYARESACCD